jgi:Tol biopolymer transport system component
MEISPDGRSVVFQVMLDGRSELWLRHMDATEAVPVPGTGSTISGNDLQQPFFSPDGRQIAFFAESAGALRKLSLDKGEIETVARISGNQLKGTWSADGTILMSSTGSKGIQRVSASGGSVTQITTITGNETSHLWPDLAPDGRHFVYLAVGRGGQSGVYVGSIDGGPPKRLLDSNFGARFAPPDRLLYVRDDDLVAQRFDFDRLELVGDPVLVVNGILRTSAGRVAVSASTNGVVVYARGDAELLGGHAVWVDRAGTPIVAAPQTKVATGGMRLSPDERFLAYAREGTAGAGMDLWLKDLTRGVETPLRFDIEIGRATSLAFSPDGSRLIAGRRADSDGAALFEIRTSGTESATPIAATSKWRFAVPRAWSADGRHLLFTGNRDGQTGMWVLPMQPAGDPMPYLVGVGTGAGGADISPDGRWVVYGLGVSRAESQVFVQSFPEPSSERWAVSGPGGVFPRWSRDGKEIFYVDAEGRLTAVSFSATARVQIGMPTPLFNVPLNTTLHPFDVAADGQRFVVLQRPDSRVHRSLTVALDWMGR